MVPLNQELPWMNEARSTWLKDVKTWLEEKLSQHSLTLDGELESVREQPWAIVLRIATSQGFVYFKAATSGARHEAALVTELSQQWSDRVPTPLAIDPQRGWMLLSDYGVTLQQKLDGADGLDYWLRLLPCYAEIQIASSQHLPRWLKIGVPDRRLEKLPALFKELLTDDEALCLGQSDGLSLTELTTIRKLLPEFETCCQELAAMPYSAALEHGDLHDNNILVKDGSYWLFDWGDTSLLHPFCSLMVTIHTLTDNLFSSQDQQRIARLREAYLEPWSAYIPTQQLRQLFPHALWIAHIGRALDWNHILADADEAARTKWQPYIATWLRLWVERQDLLHTSATHFAVKGFED